ncbi:MAG: phosphodiester glycosidase family protein [Oscillospiraceae bacterium]
MKIQQQSARKLHTNILTALWKTLAVIFIVLICIVIFLFSAMALIIHGPSISARELFVTSCMETSFAKLFPPLYLSDEEISTIIIKNSVVEIEEVTNTSADFTDNTDGVNKEQMDVEVIDITGSTYKGKMILVKDPSRVVVECPPAFGADSSGEKLDYMISKINGVAGINAGGFFDNKGAGNGGIAEGIVIKNSEVKNGNDGATSVVVGFDDKNVLRVGSMTVAKAKEIKLRDAVSFGPALVVNGKPAQVSGSGGGLNPRTAIGQREDGTVLLLVIDGRQPQSLGASYKDIVDIMIEHKAINAGNLDGGSSSMMYYKGELINQCASLYGPRKIATGFIVK